MGLRERQRIPMHMAAHGRTWRNMRDDIPRVQGWGAWCGSRRGAEDDVRLWEIAENLHRADLTILERSTQETRWIELIEREQAAERGEKPGQFDHVSAKGGRGIEGGLSAAVREPASNAPRRRVDGEGA